jgi:hypothetical protein
MQWKSHVGTWNEFTCTCPTFLVQFLVNFDIKESESNAVKHWWVTCKSVHGGPYFPYMCDWSYIVSVLTCSHHIHLTPTTPPPSYSRPRFADVSCVPLQLFNPLSPELNSICYLLALLGAHHFLHVSRMRVKSLILRLLMPYIYGAPILDVSRSHATTQHSR